jgi:hypothetical protein
LLHFSEVPNDQAADRLKVARITRYYLVGKMQRGYADLKVGKRNGDTCLPGFRINLRRPFTSFPCKRLNRHSGKDLLQVQLSLLSTLGRVRTPKSVAQLNHADRGDYDLSRSGGSSNSPQKFTDGLRATLGGYEHA